MNEEREDGTPEVPKPQSETAGPPGQRDPLAPSPLEELRDKITEVTNEFLKKHMGLEESIGRAPGATPESLSQRAEEFVRGFFRGVGDKTPRGQAAPARDPDMPSGTEIVARLLVRANEAVSDTFQNYLRDHVVDPQRPSEPVVVDGRFVLRHGAPLLVSLVQSLSARFSEANAAAAPPAATAQPPEPAPAQHVDFRVDLPSVFKSLFVRPPSDGGSR